MIANYYFNCKVSTQGAASRYVSHFTNRRRLSSEGLVKDTGDTGAKSNPPSLRAKMSSDIGLLYCKAQHNSL